ncbi:MAG: sulfatase-like hydrolase/transferase, partial [Halobacteria archaeon]
MDVPNVLLIIMDSVRSRNTSLHGYEKETTPFLNELKDEATFYEQARASGEKSVSSHVSLFTGLEVPEHGVTNPNRSLKPGNTIWETLSEDYGYSTAVFSRNVFLTQANVGLKKAFDRVEAGRKVKLPFPDAVDPREFSNFESSPDYREFLRTSIEKRKPFRTLINGILLKASNDYQKYLPGPLEPTSLDSQVFNDLFLEWESDTEEPWAACINYMDAHNPYLPREENDVWGSQELRDLMSDIDHIIWEFPAGDRPWSEREALIDLYDGCIRQIDAEIERLFANLEDRGL